MDLFCNREEKNEDEEEDKKPDIYLIKKELGEEDEIGCEAVPLHHWADLDVFEESDTENADHNNEEKAPEEPPAKKPKKALEKNQKTHQKWPTSWYRCRACVYQALNCDILLGHMLRKHTRLDLGLYRCEFCSRLQPSDYDIREHLQEHLPKEPSFDDSWFWHKYYEREDFKVKRARTKYNCLSREQKSILQQVFQTRQFIDDQTCSHLAKELKLKPARIQQWFGYKRNYQPKRKAHKQNKN